MSKTACTKWFSATRLFDRLWNFGFGVALGEGDRIPCVMFHFGPWSVVAGPHYDPLGPQETAEQPNPSSMSDIPATIDLREGTWPYNAGR